MASSQVQEAGFQTCKHSSTLMHLIEAWKVNVLRQQTLHHNTFRQLPQIVTWPLFNPDMSTNKRQGQTQEGPLNSLLGLGSDLNSHLLQSAS